LKGSPGVLFYIICKGTVKVTICSNITHTLGVGEYFGELSLFSGTRRRTATVSAEEDCILLVFDRLLFQDVAGTKSASEYLKDISETYQY
jgi:CRP-like cAMP-binding protein